MTFTSLVADMQSYLERGTPLDVQVANQIPRLINLAERAIATAIKVQGFLTIVTSKLTVGTSVYPKPNGWRQTVSMNYGTIDLRHRYLLTEQTVPTPILTERWQRIRVQPNRDPTKNQNFRLPLLARSYEYCRSYWPDSAWVDYELKKQPKFYADYDFNHWLIVPTPAINYPWEIVYYTQPPLLGQENQTNWLTDFAPNLLLYRALLEATPYLKNDERIPVWQQLYQEQLGTTNQQDLQRVADRTAVRNQA
jgi:hypothetical protein